MVRKSPAIVLTLAVNAGDDAAVKTSFDGTRAFAACRLDGTGEVDASVPS